MNGYFNMNSEKDKMLPGEIYDVNNDHRCGKRSGKPLPNDTTSYQLITIQIQLK